MKKTLLIFLIGLPVMVQAQDSVRLNRAPKQISLEIGYRRIVDSKMPNQASNGYSVLLDYAWQLSGFHGGRSTFLSVPLGYTMMMPDTDTSRSARVISYGWTVRHELRPQKGLVPYLGYGLLLNNYAVKGIDGHTFAHQTRFTLGLNHYNTSSIQPYMQVDYSMTYYPELGLKHSTPYHFVEIKLGARFMKKKKA